MNSWRVTDAQVVGENPNYVEKAAIHSKSRIHFHE